jgi:hypothetical protein
VVRPGGTSWKYCAYSIHFLKLAQVRHVNRTGHGIVEGCARLCQNSLYVLESLSGLRSNTSRYEFAGLGINAFLAGNKNEISNLNALRIRTDRQRRSGASQFLLLGLLLNRGVVPDNSAGLRLFGHLSPFVNLKLSRFAARQIAETL